MANISSGALDAIQTATIEDNQKKQKSSNDKYHFDKLKLFFGEDYYVHGIKISQPTIGDILDIGGGGEGIIGRLYTNQVISIDNRKEELDEAPDFCNKILMDATNLNFKENSFDVVTFFYSLMYMNEETKKKAIFESFRVLKTGGILCIWDTEIENTYPKPFLVELDIRFENNEVHTTYGVIRNEIQTIDMIKNHAKECGIKLILSEFEESIFYLKYCK